MRHALAVAAALLVAACGSDNRDKLPDDLASAEGVERPDDVFENQAEAEAELEPQPAPSTNLPVNEGPDPLSDPAETAPPPATAALPRPSFDCGGTLNRVESLICNDPQLSQLDRRLARDYGRAIGEASPEQRERLTNLGRRYLGDRNRCPTRDCVVQAYRWYLRDIESVMGWRSL